jgi:beta-barrel assembly-enhancing protease
LLPLTQISHAADGLPQLGDGEEMSIAAEKQLGKRIAREIYRDPDYIDDPLITAYVCSASGSRFWRQLASAAIFRPSKSSSLGK